MLYDERRQERIFAVMEVPSRVLGQFKTSHSAGPCACPSPEESAEWWNLILKERASIEDDLVPSAYMREMDQGLYTGLLGAIVHFDCDPERGRISSRGMPLVSTWEEFKRLRQHCDLEWAIRYSQMLQAFFRKSEGYFGISHLICVNGLNMVVDVFGAARAYLELRDRPEEVHEAMEFAHHVNTWVQDIFFESIPLLEGGTCSNLASWRPGREISEGIDAFHMTSSEDFTQWGIAPLSRMISRYDGGILHLHGNGHHLIEALCDVPGVRAVALFDDGGVSPSFERLPQLKKQFGDMPLIVFADYDEFSRALKKGTLPGGVLYRVMGVPDADRANHLMDEVRHYRARMLAYEKISL